MRLIKHKLIQLPSRQNTRHIKIWGKVPNQKIKAIDLKYDTDVKDITLKAKTFYDQTYNDIVSIKNRSIESAELEYSDKVKQIDIAVKII